LLAGPPSFGRYQALARYMRGFDLVLSYNWGAMDGVMAHRLFSRIMKLPPLIHHEDGFNSDEAERLKTSRNLFRRFALESAHAVVVPSCTLERIARAAWRQSENKLRLIFNGVDLPRYGQPSAADAIAGLTRVPDKLLVGTLAGLRPVKNLPRLVRAVAAHKEKLQLVIIGEGPERDAIMAEAARCGLSDLHMPGFLPEPWKYVGSFDIFALSSVSEQFPISLVEAMAAGLPAVATDVGDVSEMVAPENRPFVVAPSKEADFVTAMGAMAADARLRAAIGAANKAKALRCFAEQDMIKAYAQLYGEALCRPDALL
jgi:glycosyltransferase involved in cell wall biosynthesis